MVDIEDQQLCGMVYSERESCGLAKGASALQDMRMWLSWTVQLSWYEALVSAETGLKSVVNMLFPEGPRPIWAQGNRPWISGRSNKSGSESLSKCHGKTHGMFCPFALRSACGAHQPHQSWFDFHHFQRRSEIHLSGILMSPVHLFHSWSIDPGSEQPQHLFSQELFFVITGFKICKSIFKAKYKPRMFMYPSEGRRGLCPNILCKSSFCCCTWAWININDCFKMRKKRNFILHQKKKQLYFYCINNGKIKIFLYRVYIYSSVWLEETADTYGIRFSFYTHLYTLG